MSSGSSSCFSDDTLVWEETGVTVPSTAYASTVSSLVSGFVSIPVSSDSFANASISFSSSIIADSIPVSSAKSTFSSSVL